MNTHTFLVSDESVNSYGFKVLTNGIDTTQFEKNPIMLFQHNRPQIIGRWENLKREDGKLYADAVFDTEDAFANEIAGKVERGFLKGASVGLGSVAIENGIATSCKLFEISIVDMGSNGNALRLYTDNENTVQLKLNEIDTANCLTSILGLTDQNHTQVVAQVKTILEQNKDYKNQLEKVAQEQEHEAVILVDMAISRNLIKANFRQMHLTAFKDDFNKARNELAEMFPHKRASLVDMLSNATGERLNKGKDSWTLEDYRKNAPKELQENPQLFQQLLDQEYGTDKR